MSRSKKFDYGRVNRLAVKIRDEQGIPYREAVAKAHGILYKGKTQGLEGTDGKTNWLGWGLAGLGVLGILEMTGITNILNLNPNWPKSHGNLLPSGSGTATKVDQSSPPLPIPQATSNQNVLVLKIIPESTNQRRIYKLELKSVNSQISDLKHSKITQNGDDIVITESNDILKIGVVLSDKNNIKDIRPVLNLIQEGNSTPSNPNRIFTYAGYFYDTNYATNVHHFYLTLN